MTWYTEPNTEQLEAAHAAVFLAETRRALRSEHVLGLILRLEVTRSIHNQRTYRLHAAVGDTPITSPDGYPVHPITGTPYDTARALARHVKTATNTPPASTRDISSEPSTQK